MIIFDERGVQIDLVDGTYYLCGEDGGHQVTYLRIPVSKEDAERVMEDINYSLQLVWDYKNRLRGLL